MSEEREKLIATVLIWLISGATISGISTRYPLHIFVLVIVMGLCFASVAITELIWNRGESKSIKILLGKSNGKENQP